MPQPVQTFENHVRLDPGYHFITQPLLLLGAIGSCVNLVLTLTSGPTLREGIGAASLALLGAGAVLASIYTRIYALRVQDRAIALEVAERYGRLSGNSFHQLAEKLTTGQVVALRFASDGELVALADRAAAEGTKSRDIKRAIKAWRGDYRRV